jgi:hypothetical protein
MLNKKQSLPFTAFKVVLLMGTIYLIIALPSFQPEILFASFAIVAILEFIRYRNTKDQW